MVDDRSAACDAGYQENASAWFGLMSPKIGPALAAWLRAEATLSEHTFFKGKPMSPALDLARALLREDQP